jgi:hypothetical protein
MQFDALTALTAAFLSVFAPALDAITCHCASDEAAAPSQSCCCDDEEDVVANGGTSKPESEEHEHPCSNGGASCCCERAHDAIPVDDATSTPSAGHALILAPVPIDLWVSCDWLGVRRPFGRARCRDGPDLFVLNALRL